MQAFKLDWDSNHYRNLVLARESDWQYLLDIDGKPLTVKRSFDVDFVDEPRGTRRLLETDLPSFTSTLPVFSDRARRVIEDLAEGRGQWIQLNSEKGPFWGLNITDVRDALDREMSEYKCFPDGRIMWVYRYALRESALVDATFFKVKETSRAVAFMTGVVADRIRSAGFEGLILEEVTLTP